MNIISPIFKSVLLAYQKAAYTLPDYPEHDNYPFVGAQFNQIKIKQADIVIDPIIGPLKIPRWYSEGQDERNQLTAKIGTGARSAFFLALSENTGATWQVFSAWLNKCTEPLDGGKFTDTFINRPEGDTPIVICTAMPPFLYAYSLCQYRFTPDQAFSVALWLNKFIRYASEYKCVQLNNHHSWKAYFCLLGGAVLKSEYYWNLGLKFLNWSFLNQFDSNYDQPLELARGDTGNYYSLMNLEALGLSLRLVHQVGIADWDDKYFKALERFKTRSLPEWGWIYEAFGKTPLTYSWDLIPNGSHCTYMPQQP